VIDPNDPIVECVPSSTHKFTFGCGSVYAIIDEIEGRPFRVFIKKGHTGICNQALLEAIGRLLTIIVQRTDLDLDRVWRTLIGITCDSGTFGRVSCMDMLAKCLRGKYSQPNSSEESPTWPPTI